MNPSNNRDPGMPWVKAGLATGSAAFSFVHWASCEDRSRPVQGLFGVKATANLATSPASVINSARGCRPSPTGRSPLRFSHAPAPLPAPG